MIWNAFLYVLAFFLPNGHNHSQQQEEYVPTLHGPQSAEEAAKAYRALHGKHYGGDMILPDRWNESDAGIRNEYFRWPGYPGGALVPVRIDESVAQYRDVIIQGIQAYHKNTCIRFKDWEGENDFVNIFYGQGCWSAIGKNGGRQDLSLGDGCGYVGLVVHELGHAIGLFHEHQRSDRNNYITVYKQNVQQGQEHNFDLTDPNSELIFTGYDYQSIMHYGNYAFSVQPNRLPTMVANDGTRLVEPYDKHQFTQNDLITISRLYQC